MVTFIKPFHLMRILRNGAEHSIRCDHAHRSITRWPHEFPTVQLRPGVFSCHEDPRAIARLAKLNGRITKLIPRIRRMMAYVEARNLAMAKMNPEALLECGSGCLKWYECLPPGVDYQTAARLTNRTIMITQWGAGTQQHTTIYKP